MTAEVEDSIDRTMSYALAAKLERYDSGHRSRHLDPPRGVGGG
ncbi:hypothetical protein AB0D46_31170 [Streptomyces sp. NPDC048383]